MQIFIKAICAKELTLQLEASDKHFPESELDLAVYTLKSLIGFKAGHNKQSSLVTPMHV